MTPDVADKVLRLLGLGVRSRGAVVGVERVREAASKGTVVLAVVATDVSAHSLEKVLPLLAAKRVPVLSGPGAEALGHAVGRERTAVVGIVDRNLARGVRSAAGDAVASGRTQGQERTAGAPRTSRGD